ncbi:glycoside hydrolase family 3 N-terminal domain-containing protein [Phormidium sp. FACHB-1136]|uniref:glycoside hydrolase family 3 N-terminal domain-containing protein n=1 Tax=Phormidium sp. FACHB-1136 TaxID=2692848 RepID=UPI0016862535|nr:glycoside hydrolase family 3 N-terminal domain-containing protein [Phormidium sp. FACHB-1136]MBD2425130.1 beta-glucosidase [Phormidium sp. FACHB-1136]
MPSPDALSLAEQVAQMVVVRTSGHLFDHEIRYPAWEADRDTLHHYLADLGVGGVILLGGSAAEVGLKTEELQTLAQVPLLIAADIEEGVGQRFSGATWFPPPMALAEIAKRDLPQAEAYAEAMGAVTAEEALAIGLNWVLAPVADVNNNPENPVINVRAFGDTPEIVAALTTAFVCGAQRQGALTTAKHFPGHGDTAVDSHLELPTLPHNWERLQRVELPPFQALIAAGVDTVMTAHLTIPALDRQYPATLSDRTLTRLLREKMGFTGLIVTDALIMGAITRTYGPYEAAVLAVEAGADVLLMPTDPEGCIKAVVEAVTTGRIPPERIADSVERLWRAKQRVASRLSVPPESCHAWEHIPPPPIHLDPFLRPESQRLATNILTASMTVVGQVPPGDAQHPGDNLILVDSVVDCPFLNRTAPAIALPAQSHYQLQLVDHQGCQRWPQADTLRPTLMQIFLRGNPFRGSAAVSPLVQAWIEAILNAQCLQGLVIYGSPYALDYLKTQYLGVPTRTVTASAEAPDPSHQDLPYGFSYGQMAAAQHHLLTALGLGTTTTERPTQTVAFTD